MWVNSSCDNFDNCEAVSLCKWWAHAHDSNTEWQSWNTCALRGWRQTHGHTHTHTPRQTDRHRELCFRWYVTDHTLCRLCVKTVIHGLAFCCPDPEMSCPGNLNFWPSCVCVRVCVCMCMCMCVRAYGNVWIRTYKCFWEYIFENKMVRRA